MLKNSNPLFSAILGEVSGVEINRALPKVVEDEILIKE